MVLEPVHPGRFYGHGPIVAHGDALLRDASRRNQPLEMWMYLQHPHAIRNLILAPTFLHLPAVFDAIILPPPFYTHPGPSHPNWLHYHLQPAFLHPHPLLSFVYSLIFINLSMVFH